jgi:hypothetical protein
MVFLLVKVPPTGTSLIPLQVRIKEVPEGEQDEKNHPRKTMGPAGRFFPDGLIEASSQLDA